MLTQEKLKSILEYNPDTGIFICISNHRQWKYGSQPGSYERGYFILKINSIKYRAHRLVWLYLYGKWPDGEIDHINGIKDDNRLINLRDTDDYQNQQNRINRNINNTTGHKGVTFDKLHKKYRANLFYHGKRIYIPPSNSLEEAIEARKEAEIKYYTHSPSNRTL